MTDKDPVATRGQDQGGGVDPLVGKVLSDRYELVALVARGGMGKIYKAIQRPLGRPVALKILDVIDDDREFRDRFFLEASLCAKLTHPHTIRIYDYGTTSDGIFYIAMEFLEGESLHHVLGREAPLEPLRAIRVVRQICGALGEAHDCGIVHRDLKPGNIFLTRHGEDGEFVKVLDFGLVKELGKESELSRTGAVLGSPLYISPEQVNGQAVDQRADIYAIGLILYYMLTGRTAFRKANALSLLLMQTSAPPPPFSEANPDRRVTAALEWVVMRCLEKRADDRFASMHELLRALKACEKELRGEIPAPLALKLRGGMLLLPEGLEISSEIRLPCPHPAGSDPTADPGSRPGIPSEPNTTLVTTGRPGARVGLVVLLGASAAIVGFAVLVAVVVVAIVGGTLATQDGTPERVPVEVAPAPAAPAPAPASPATVEIVLTSAPSGAEVLGADRAVLGNTPLRWKIPVGSEVLVTVQAKGFEPKPVKLSSDIPEPTVELVPVKRTAPRPAPAPPPAPVVPPKPQRDRDLRNPFEDEP